jgi:hypothetical protein
MDEGNIRTCELCERSGVRCDSHHLIPRTRHKNKRNKREFDRHEVKDRTVWLCHPCHGTVHTIFTEKELERELNSLEKIKSHEVIQRHVVWIQSKSNDFKLKMNRSERR